MTTSPQSDSPSELQIALKNEIEQRLNCKQKSSYATGLFEQSLEAITRLTSRLKEKSEIAQKYEDRYFAALKAHAELTSSNDALKKIADEYVQHHEWCDLAKENCSCGLNALKSKIK